VHTEQEYYGVRLILGTGEIPLSVIWTLFGHCGGYGIHCSWEGILYMDMTTDISINASHVSVGYVGLIRV
jgi:hypothetical protein